MWRVLSFSLRKSIFKDVYEYARVARIYVFRTRNELSKHSGARNKCSYVTFQYWVRFPLDLKIASSALNYAFGEIFLYSLGKSNFQTLLGRYILIFLFVYLTRFSLRSPWKINAERGAAETMLLNLISKRRSQIFRSRWLHKFTLNFIGKRNVCYSR